MILCTLCRRRRGRPVCLGQDAASLGNLCPGCHADLRELIHSIMECALALRRGKDLLKIFRALFKLARRRD